MADSYVFYRFPSSDSYTEIRQHEGLPAALQTCSGLNGVGGFVFAPFHVSDRHPILVIRPDEVVVRAVIRNVDFAASQFYGRDVAAERLQYIGMFDKFHSRIVSGQFGKIVLSRCSVERSCARIDAELLFYRACSLYPQMFVALVSTPQSGTWLAATPEALLDGKGGKFHTMAVAGTVKANGACASRSILQWDGKNIREQQYVAEYIRQCVSKYSGDIRDNGLYTLRAGTVEHLATDFFFTLDKGRGGIGDLVGDLYPTPAVCGTPKMPAYSFIQENEACDRSYYGGFAGPMDCNGDACLYVTLRCMQTDGHCHRLYAGGGLLEDSDAQSEWLETEAKMEAMRKCLAIK